MENQALVTIIPWTFIAQILNLFIQMYLVKRFLFKPIKEILAKRQALSDEQLDIARASRAEADALKEQYENSMANAKAEANEIITAATKTAEQKSDEIIGDANRKAAAAKVKAEAEIAQERKKAVNELKNEIGGMAIDLAGKVIEREISEENAAAAMMEELDGIQKIFRENPDYTRLLSEPSIPRAERISLIDQAFDGQVHPYVNNFMKVLCREGLIRELTGCIAQFRSRFYKDQNIAEAVVTSAVPLNEKQISALLEKLEKMSGKTILLQQKVDAKVIGGLKVEVDGKQLDGTLENRISTVRRKVTEIIL